MHSICAHMRLVETALSQSMHVINHKIKRLINLFQWVWKNILTPKRFVNFSFVWCTNSKFCFAQISSSITSQINHTDHPSSACSPWHHYMMQSENYAGQIRWNQKYDQIKGNQRRNTEDIYTSYALCSFLGRMIKTKQKPFCNVHLHKQRRLILDSWRRFPINNPAPSLVLYPRTPINLHWNKIWLGRIYPILLKRKGHGFIHSAWGVLIERCQGRFCNFFREYNAGVGLPC